MVLPSYIDYPNIYKTACFNQTNYHNLHQIDETLIIKKKNCVDWKIMGGYFLNIIFGGICGEKKNICNDSSRERNRKSYLSFCGPNQISKQSNAFRDRKNGKTISRVEEWSLFIIKIRFMPDWISLATKIGKLTIF